MSQLLDRLENLSVPSHTAIAWLGQAGICLRTSTGRLILVDPYLSDACEDIYGLRRIMQPPFEANEIQPDVVLITHWHEDHLDRPSIQSFMETARFVGPPSCCARLTGQGVPSHQVASVEPGTTLRLEELQVTATFATHAVPGYLTEDAVGYLLRVDGFSIYNVGDTVYDRRLVAPDRLAPDLCVLPINGTGGNMDAYEAALVAWRLRCKAVMPVHFGMWSDIQYGHDATLDPNTFIETYRALGGEASIHVPRIGEILMMSGDSMDVESGP